MRQFGLIGYPLSHSFSQMYFTDKFQRENLLDCTFEVFPLSHVSEIRNLYLYHPQLKGLAVTIPYKEQVLPYLSCIDEIAELVNAVNCIKISGQERKGFNTDVIGFERSFLPLLKPHHTKALVLGNGGAAKAVFFVLNKLGIPFINVSRFNQNQSGQINYSGLHQSLIEEYTIIINATPVGMFPSVDEAPPIPYDGIGSQHFLFDLIYNPEQTKFLEEGKSRGAIVKNGMDMLKIQAEENWKIWNS